MLSHLKSIPYSLEIDAPRVQQVIINLLTNAIKFTESGSVDLVVCGKEEADEGYSLSISVKDSGLGITLENQTSIFKPFVQGDGSITRKFGGTGLGLSISSMLIKLMGERFHCNQKKEKVAVSTLILSANTMTRFLNQHYYPHSKRAK